MEQQKETQSSASQKNLTNKTYELDANQKNACQHFSSSKLIGKPKSSQNFLEWVTFYRRNLHRFAMDYLGLTSLFLYQQIALYLMGINNRICIIATRSAAKSFMIAIYACCIAILYPRSQIILASATRGQSKLIISNKIKTELQNMSPTLRKEIKDIKENTNEAKVIFHNGSIITVVTANENARGNRSTVIVREEFRMINKTVDDSILSPFQIMRQTPYRNLPEYADRPELQEENIDIYISSSWLDNGHWMWDKIVDPYYKDMINDKASVLLSFDESVVLKHKIKSISNLQGEKAKADPLTWKIEYLNERVKESSASYFTYSMLMQNQKAFVPFYPREADDIRNNRKNPYLTKKIDNEIRIVACDMAFASGSANDNSIFTCMSAIPEEKTVKNGDTEFIVQKSYRRKVHYMTSVNGGDTTRQALTIRRLYEEFNADYIVLDSRNGGIAIYDMLARPMFDSETGKTYSPLCCMNNDEYANRIRVEGSEPRIFVINATQKLNSDIAMEFRNVLTSKMIDLPLSLNGALEEVLPNIREYSLTEYGEVQAFYEAPFLETQEFISETTSLVYEKKEQTGVIVIHEQGHNRKDRYTSCSYGSYFIGQLEKDLISDSDAYEAGVFIN